MFIVNQYFIFNIVQGYVLTYYRRFVLLQLFSVILLLVADVLYLYSHNAASTNDISKRTMMIEITEITSAELADEGLSKKQSGLISTVVINKTAPMNYNFDCCTLFLCVGCKNLRR